MPQYWLKPFGTTNPPRRIDRDWVTGENVDLNRYDILSGPSTQRQPPQMGGGDQIIFHAIGYAQLFGAGEILASSTYSEHPFWKDRFPWVYPVRVDVWIPLVTDGPRTSEITGKKVMGRLQAGAPYVRLTAEEYGGLLNELLKVPSAKTRDSTSATHNHELTN